VTNVEFFVGARKIGQMANAPYYATVSDLGPGSYPVTARATDDRGAITTSAIVNIQIVGPALNHLEGVFATNRYFHICFTGEPGRTYIIQASTNFVNWVPVSTNTLVDSALSYYDTAATNFPYRFFRAVRLP